MRRLFDAADAAKSRDALGAAALAYGAAYLAGDDATKRRAWRALESAALALQRDTGPPAIVVPALFGRRR